MNVGALVPFSPLRGYVLGMIPARERTSVTEAELNQMKQILYDSMKAGASGSPLTKTWRTGLRTAAGCPATSRRPRNSTLCPR